jgi:hypothetical protein
VLAHRRRASAAGAAGEYILTHLAKIHALELDEASGPPALVHYVAKVLQHEGDPGDRAATQAGLPERDVVPTAWSDELTVSEHCLCDAVVAEAKRIRPALALTFAIWRDTHCRCIPRPHKTYRDAAAENGIRSTANNGAVELIRKRVARARQWLAQAARELASRARTPEQQQAFASLAARLETNARCFPCE